MKKLIPIIIVLFGLNSFAQDVDSVSNNTAKPLEWNYSMPFLGKKVAERGYHQLLPFGLNLNYINTKMDLDVTEFTLTIGDNPQLNSILEEYVNMETLNFSSTTAFANGFNLRPDVMIFPFMSVYGIYALNEGYTEVSLQPTWYDEFGEIAVQTPIINSRVEYQAQSWGVGATLFYGFKNFFMSVDGNYTSTQSAILDKPAEVITASARVGYKFDLNKDKEKFFAFYIGLMTRDFLKPGSQGQVKLDEALPGLQDGVEAAIINREAELIAKNNDVLIPLKDDLTTQSNDLQAQIDAAPPIDKPALIAEKASVDAKITGVEGAIALNEYRVDVVLEDIRVNVLESEVFQTEINYFIKKELIQPTTFEMGFNLQLNPHWMIRGEYGISGPQHFLMTGLQYRFGF